MKFSFLVKLAEKLTNSLEVSHQYLTRKEALVSRITADLALLVEGRLISREENPNSP